MKLIFARLLEEWRTLFMGLRYNTIKRITKPKIDNPIPVYFESSSVLKIRLNPNISEIIAKIKIVPLIITFIQNAIWRWRMVFWNWARSFLSVVFKKSLYALHETNLSIWSSVSLTFGVRFLSAFLIFAIVFLVTGKCFRYYTSICCNFRNINKNYALFPLQKLLNFYTLIPCHMPLDFEDFFCKVGISTLQKGQPI